MEKLKEKLIFLAANNSLNGVIGGTEDEAMSFEEILLLKEISENIVPMTVKIGGLEARNDIDFMKSIGIDTILAPMIESAYGLKNFVNSMNEIDKNKKIKLAVNIETINAYADLYNIYYCKEFEQIEQVYVDISDLSGSMNKYDGDYEVITISKNIIDCAKRYGKLTSAGRVYPGEASYISHNINSDFINTRHMIISNKSDFIEKNIELALLWEKDFYEYLGSRFTKRISFYKNRIETIEERLKIKKMA
jgi:hypothetical protein